MVFGGIGGVVTLAGQLWSSALGAWGVYGTFFTLSMMSLNVIYSSMIGLNADVIPEHQVGVANGIQAVLSVTGALFGMFFFLGTGGNVPSLYVLFILLVSSTIAVTFFHVKEKPLEPLKGERRMFTSLTRSQVLSSYYLSPTQHTDFFIVTLSRTFYYMGVSAQTFFLYYLKDVVKMDNPAYGVTVLSSVAQGCAALSAYPVGMLSDKLGMGRKVFIYASCFILMAGNFSFIFSRTLGAVIVIAACIGLGNGGYLAMDSALAIDVIPVKDDAAKFLGIWGVGEAGAIYIYIYICVFFFAKIN